MKLKFAELPEERIRGKMANKIIIDEVQDVEACHDLAIDESPEDAQADLKKEDPKEDEIEKTLASYGIVLDYVYDFSADQNKPESLEWHGCQRWNKDGTK